MTARRHRRTIEGGSPAGTGPAGELGRSAGEHGCECQKLMARRPRPLRFKERDHFFMAQPHPRYPGEALLAQATVRSWSAYLRPASVAQTESNSDLVPRLKVEAIHWDELRDWTAAASLGSFSVSASERSDSLNSRV